MENSIAGNIQFQKKQDYQKLGGLMALSYTGFAASLYLQQAFNSAAGYLGHFALIGSLFLALRTPVVREVPLAIGMVFNRLVMAQRLSIPHSTMVDDCEDLRRKAGITRRVRLFIIESGLATSNAFTNSKDIYVGRKLVEKMNRKELKSVIAHEMAHIKTEDVSERYLSWPPYIDSIVLLITSATAFFSAYGSGNSSLTATAATTLALSYAYFKFQQALNKTYSRIGEYRADRNGIQLTGDFKSAATALVKVDKQYIKRLPARAQIFESHPRGLVRLRAMESSATPDGKTPVFDRVENNTAILEDALRNTRWYEFIDPVKSIETVYDNVHSKSAPAPAP